MGRCGGHNRRRIGGGGLLWKEQEYQEKNNKHDEKDRIGDNETNDESVHDDVYFYFVDENKK